MSRYDEIDIGHVKPISIKSRKNKVNVEEFASPYRTGMSFRDFWHSLPNILVGEELREFVGHVVEGYRKKKPLIWMMGAHVIKCGLSPVIIDLMERGIISAVSMNGAGPIHDTELAYWGQTSEDVATNLQNGTFGMSGETAEKINGTVAAAVKDKLGYGEALGKRIFEEKPPFWQLSILGNAYRLGVPVTVHVGVGTDIVHQHPNAKGSAIGELSLRDFRILARVISKLGHGGVVVLAGSTVILPEVFLKALTVARNIGYDVKEFFTANFDMFRHYRPSVNVVQRPTLDAGKGYQFIGHHEIMIPLLAAAILEELE
ncbi:MAG: hypothetical protein GXO76_10340 [Calditrichaeota bacterium]|nr:hypothetical protein [Calditrichota bacterium]